MKETFLSCITIIALSGVAYAGGDITPVEEVVEPLVQEESSYYIGMGVGGITLNNDSSNEEFTSTQLMLQMGYQYNKYIAVEGRYAFGFNTDYEVGTTPPVTSYGDISNWGIYLKPMYPIGDFSVYALLGYGGVILDKINDGDAYENGFQWGLGAQYAITQNISVFIDYVSLYNDTGFDYIARYDDIDSDVWTLGMSYRF